MNKPTVPEDLYTLPHYHCQNCQEEDLPATLLYYYHSNSHSWNAWMCQDCGDKHEGFVQGISLMELLEQERIVVRIDHIDIQRLEISLECFQHFVRAGLSKLYHAIKKRRTDHPDEGAIIIIRSEKT